MSRYEGQADFFFDDRFFLVVVFRRTGFLFTAAFFLGSAFFLDAVFLREAAFFLLVVFFLVDAFLREAGFFRLTAFFLAAVIARIVLPGLSHDAHRAAVAHPATDVDAYDHLDARTAL